MIFEMTRDYTIIVPLMISNLIAFFISHRLQKEPIYEALARQEGVHLPTTASRLQSGRLRVAEVMRLPEVILAPDDDLASALDRARRSLLDACPVEDEEGLCGMVRNTELEQAVFHGNSGQKLSDIVGDRFQRHANTEQLPHVHPDHSLSLALERMGTAGLHVLPVVSRANVRQLTGIVVLEDVLHAYGIGSQPATKE